VILIERRSPEEEYRGFRNILVGLDCDAGGGGTEGEEAEFGCGIVE
jgi:hypothetical protein